MGGVRDQAPVRAKEGAGEVQALLDVGGDGRALQDSAHLLWGHRVTRHCWPHSTRNMAPGMKNRTLGLQGPQGQRPRPEVGSGPPGHSEAVDQAVSGLSEGRPQRLEPSQEPGAPHQPCTLLSMAGDWAPVSAQTVHCAEPTSCPQAMPGPGLLEGGHCLGAGGRATPEPGRQPKLRSTPSPA